MKKSTLFTRAISARAIFLVVIGVMATAMFVIALQGSQPAGVAAAAPQPQEMAAARPPAAQPQAVPLQTTQPQTRKTAAPKAASRAVAVNTDVADTTAANAPAVELAPKAFVETSAPVTITGCLELNEETFRLKDTTGADAPKARSWRSAFLKKGPAPIEVVDAANRLKLPSHVGQRVTVTGKLVDRELQVRSLERVAPSCSQKPLA